MRKRKAPSSGKASSSRAASSSQPHIRAVEPTPISGFNKRKFRKSDTSHPANRPITKQWDEFDEAFHEKFERISFPATRYTAFPYTQELGLYDELRRFAQRAGLGEIFEPLSDCVYPKVCRQFMASARLSYPDPDNPVADTGTFSFIVYGRFYSMTLFELCDVFGFAKGRLSEIPYLPCAQEFWDLIAGGDITQIKNAKISKIRNPVLRYAAKIIGSHIYGKAEIGAISHEELTILFLGVRDFWPRAAAFNFPQAKDINLGAVLAEKFAYYKASMIDKGKALAFGGLITRILRHKNIPIREDPAPVTPRNNARYHFCDQRHLVDTGFLTGRTAVPVYHFYDRQGVSRFLTLPRTDLTDIASPEALEFLPSQHDLCPCPPSFTKAKGVGSSKKPVQPTEVAEEEAPDADSSEEDLFPEDFTPYQLAPPPTLTCSKAEFRAWTVEAHQKNNNILLKMWKALKKMGAGCSSSPAVSGDGSDASMEEAESAADGSEEADETDTAPAEPFPLPPETRTKACEDRPHRQSRRT